MLERTFKNIVVFIFISHKFFYTINITKSLYKIKLSKYLSLKYFLRF